MINKFLKIIFFGSTILVLCLSFNSGALALTNPQVQTNSATNIQSTSVVLNGNINDLGGDNYVYGWFQYGTDATYGNATAQHSFSSIGPFSQTISGLAPNTTFHFRAAAFNGYGTVYGQGMTFATISGNSQQLTANAGPDQNVNSSQTIVLQGSGYDPNGGSVNFNWTCTGGTLSNYSIAQPVYTAPNVSQNTNYTCTLTVSNNSGLSNSDIVTITVNSQNQNISVQTNSATNISGSQATLNGNLYGINTSSTNYVWFQYGTSTSYGYQTNQQTLNNNGTFTQNIASLSSNATYHFRAVAQSSGGNAVYGQDMTFYTTGSGITTAVYTTSGSNLLSVSKTVKNLSSGNLNPSSYISASPSDVLMFTITLQAISNQDIHNVFVRDILPANLTFYNNLAVTGSSNYSGGSYGDITSGINLGTIPANQSVIITYQAQVAPSQNFSSGTTNLTNSVTVTSTETSANASVSITVDKSGFSTASYISTGLTNDFLTDSFFLPLMIIVLGAWLYWSGVIFRFTEWVRVKAKINK